MKPRRNTKAPTEWWRLKEGTEVPSAEIYATTAQTDIRGDTRRRNRESREVQVHSSERSTAGALSTAAPPLWRGTDTAAPPASRGLAPAMTLD